MELEKAAQEDEDRDLVAFLLDTLLLPVRTLASLPARRFYLRSILLLIAIPILSLLSIIAYIAFYNTYIPPLTFTTPIHLQFHPDHAHHPYGVASLSASSPNPADISWSSSPLVSSQPYDITLHMTLPRSPPNLDAGNFMLELQLLGPGNGSFDTTADSIISPILASSSRPAIITYRSSMVRLAGNVMGLAAYAAGWAKEEEELRVEMMKGWAAQRGWRNVPSAVRVEVVSREVRLEVYEVSVEFKARFSGIRYLMHNHRIVSFIAFTSTFFAISLASTLLVYLLSSYLFSSPSRSSISDSLSPRRIKSESSPTATDTATDPALSDTSRMFPTSSRQPPLHYFSGSRIKHEDEEEEDDKFKAFGAAQDEGDAAAPTTAEAEADDEDEDEDADFILDSNLGAGGGAGRSDSGLGTSMESSAGSGSVRRRGSRGKGRVS